MSQPHRLSVFYRQHWQFLLAILGCLFGWYVQTRSDVINGQVFWGLGISFWFWLAILIPITHQLIIAPLWRVELLEQQLTAMFGTTEKAFLFFKIVFALFFIPRMVITIPLAVATRNSLPTGWHVVTLMLGIVMTPIILYGFYSVERYFGINRAFGADHFFDSYQSLPRVHQGIFKYTNNGMYVVVMAFTWLPGLYFASYPAILAGLFNQLFVWVHYYCTEKPDMDYIYGTTAEN